MRRTNTTHGCDEEAQQLTSRTLSIGNVTHKLQLYAKDVSNDFIWLTPKVIEQFDKWGHEKTAILNNGFDLETGIIQWNRGTYYKITNYFSETLYLQYMFLSGHLMGSPLSHRVNYGYFANMHNVLLQLCVRGVYVIEGTEPIIGKTPSQCAFIVLIRDEVMIPFMDMMDDIYTYNINVDACRIKARKVILQYNKNKNSRISCAFKVDTPFLCGRFDILGGIGTPDMRRVDGLDNCSFSLWHVKIWHQSVKDCVHVEDMLLHLWIKFNSLYGHANNDMFVV
jgi:hypothetical protein